ncbi:TonB-dependent receptor family protein [Larkinella sp. VNQ87]|uniref:TonB-dependent receptor family protein n=1 Tax=Larkinella sp. VNQ87 TaxID=3400921 RepID=UPI003C036158
MQTQYRLHLTLYYGLHLLLSLLPVGLWGQSNPNRNPPADSARVLREVAVRGFRLNHTEALPDVQGTYLMAGKRSEVVRLAGIDANVAEKTGRQLFARIPGVFVYDMDGTGNQINIATRGLDPHRSWELNSRQNGVIINSDLYGYPASHYSPPLESMERVELVRGTASLQYGAQFGGMIDYVTKTADTTRRLGFETTNSIGSFGLRSTYNALGGRIGKWTYYTYDYRRASDGYRANSRSTAQTQFLSLRFRASKRVEWRAEVGRSTYRHQIPGPLTDSLFLQNPRQSTRSRNYFNPDIWVPSVRLDWRLSGRTQLSWTTSAVLGARNSVQFDAFANVPDAVDEQTGFYKNRQVDIDRFNSYTSELRLLHRYQLAGLKATLAFGMQGINNDLHRQQVGKGTTGSDFDLSLTNPVWGRDLHLRSRNGAFFAENQVQVTPRLQLAGGFRAENGASRMSGTIGNDPLENVPALVRHRFVLFGFNAQYRFNPATRLYGGWSQAYRPVIFKDLIPASVYERVADNLKDARGHNAEIGLEGQWKTVRWNVSLFELLYRNRMGNLLTGDSAGPTLVLRSNVGDSRSRGLEALVEATLMRGRRWSIQFFSSTAYMDARYRKASLSNGKENVIIDGNRVESVPVWTSRNGITIQYRRIRFTSLYSYVGKTFSDAFNTSLPSANGARGLVPDYGLLDVMATWQAHRRLLIRGSLNNVLDKSYFTKRPAFYPGPGIWPSDGRGGVVTAALTL